ncbi:MAG TPA: shikimate dehydrogenase [Desulfuromonadales bacterium]|nr:shikimate dehydrogenase [Desulfuromonadales bacterium]
MKKDGIIASSTQLCAVIGNPVSHSLSPAIHNAGFNELGLDFVYLAFPVEDLKSALSGMRALKSFRGMSVTIPHKVEALQYVDEVAEVDRYIGSINTIINENGKLKAFGTDGPGALKALKDAGVTLEGANVLMLGAGGAARAIAFTLASETRLEGLTILDVNEAVLLGLADDLKNGTPARINAEVFGEDSLAQAMEKAHVIINCTPIGMHPHRDASLVPVRLFRTGQVVFDIIYNPLETKLLADARAHGLKTVSGVEMFINQAVLQFRHFTGEDAPIEVMRKVLMQNLGC